MKVLNVLIGEVKVATDGETLQAILGSCVGIGVIWRGRNLGGLAHCLLPEAPTGTVEIGGRFVTQAVPSLLKLMNIVPSDYAELEIVIAGGGNMTNAADADPATLIGTLNLDAAAREISRLGITPALVDGGGPRGRKIKIDSRRGTFEVQSIPRLLAVG